ncbi:hypothetical protein DFJ73DRAFT_873998 [Zopfochytrium polystomum]|nr:hypothetical protein DFJ73DRAFT_873998 [Zopfochytrium polystomum]
MKLGSRPAIDLIIAGGVHLLAVVLSIAATATIGWFKGHAGNVTSNFGLFQTQECGDGNYCISGSNFCSADAPRDILSTPCSQLKAMGGLMVIADIVGLVGLAAYPCILVFNERVSPTLAVIVGLASLFITSLFNLVSMSLAASIMSSELFKIVSTAATITYGSAFAISIVSWIFGFGGVAFLGYTYYSFKSEF